MPRNRRLLTVLRVLLAAIALISLDLFAWGQSEYKTLHRFTKEGERGSEPTGGLSLIRKEICMAQLRVAELTSRVRFSN